MSISRHRARSWAQRLKRVFAIEIETCRHYREHEGPLKLPIRHLPGIVLVLTSIGLMSRVHATEHGDTVGIVSVIGFMPDTFAFVVSGSFADAMPEGGAEYRSWCNLRLMIRNSAAACLTCLLVSAAAAQPQPYMNKETPEELPVVVSVQQACPITGDEALGVIQDALGRSQIEFIDAYAEALGEQQRVLEFPWLRVDLTCMSDGGNAFFLSADFLLADGERGLYRAGEDHVRSAVGTHTGRGDYLLGAVQSIAELVIADYLQANAGL